MRPLYPISFVVLIALFASCSKKDNTNPVPVKNNDNVAKPVKMDSVAQLPVTNSFTPYTDSFCGTASDQDAFFSLYGDSIRNVHVYIFHPTLTEIKISSDNYYSPITSGSVSFLGNFSVNDSNVYSSVFAADSYYKYRISKDSLYCTASREVCPDVDVSHFAGKRTNSKLFFNR